MTPATSLPTEYAHVVRTPGVVGGEARIEGHRIRVRDIVLARDLRGFTPEEIAATVYPSITLAQVYAALAYYEDHQEEIFLASTTEAEATEAFVQQYPALVRDLRVPHEAEP